MAKDVLYDLNKDIKRETYKNPLAALDIILQAMKNHLADCEMQTVGRYN